MTAIKPEINLFTNHEADNNSIQIKSLILAYNGNYYHLQGGTGDTIHVFIQSIAIYVLTINKGHGRMALNAYMVPQPDVINGVYLHSPQDIERILGAKWGKLPPKAIAEKLINYLM